MKNTIGWLAFNALVTTICIATPFSETLALQKRVTKYSLNNENVESSDGSLPYIVQSNPLYGCWSLTYNVFGIVYESLLRMNGYRGVMLTSYFNSNINRTDYVQQTMRLGNSPRGLVIYGNNPVSPGTNRRHPSYVPDNFLFQIKPNGKKVFGMCDNANRCSPVEVRACPK